MVRSQSGTRQARPRPVGAVLRWLTRGLRWDLGACQSGAVTGGRLWLSGGMVGCSDLREDMADKRNEMLTTQQTVERRDGDPRVVPNRPQAVLGGLRGV